MPSKEEIFYLHENCGYIGSSADWEAAFVYHWKLEEETLSFVRCPKCMSDIAKQSLVKIDKL